MTSKPNRRNRSARTGSQTAPVKPLYVAFRRHEWSIQHNTLNARKPSPNNQETAFAN